MTPAPQSWQLFQEQLQEQPTYRGYFFRNRNPEPVLFSSLEWVPRFPLLTRPQSGDLYVLESVFCWGLSFFLLVFFIASRRRGKPRSSDSNGSRSSKQQRTP